MNIKGEILHEQIIFIILNVVFFSVLIGFIYLQSSSIRLSEEETAKQIALLIDSSRPGTEIEVNLEKFFEKLEGVSEENSVIINNNKNLVIVKGSKDSFYEYSYFNDVDVEYDFKEGNLILVIK